jgi:Ca-activated chloride channel family protein
MNRRSLLRALPYAALGFAGVAGLFAVTTQRLPATAPTPPNLIPPVAPAGNGAFHITAAFDHDVLPADADRAFVRVGITGREQAAVQRLPADVVLVIDRSGSMSGQKIEDAKRAAKRALEALRPGDRFRVLAFGSTVEELGHGVVGGERSDLSATFGAIDRLIATGGTDMRAALGRVQALGSLGAEGRVSRVFLVSDGQPDTEAGLRDRVGELAGRGVLTTTIGVGLDYNEDLMAALADTGRGNYHFVERATNLAGVFETELKDLAAIVARDVVVHLNGTGVGTPTPLGIPALHSRNGVRVAVGDIYAGRTVELLFEVPLANRGDLGRVDVTALARELAPVTTVAQATFSEDPRTIAASVNNDVQVQAARWQTSQVLTQANVLYNDSNVDDANRALDVQIQQLEEQAQQFSSAALKSEVAELKKFRADNNDASMSRRSLNNYAKWKARGLNR